MINETILYSFCDSIHLFVYSLERKILDEEKHVYGLGESWILYYFIISNTFEIIDDL